MKLTAITLATFFILSPAFGKTLEDVIEERIELRQSSINDLHRSYSRERLGYWLPNTTRVTYASNDNHTWKSWNLMTNVPLPFKSLYRDETESARADASKASAEVVKQRVLRETVEAHLECAIPSEMTLLLNDALRDQRVVAAISNSLYATGSVTQSDRVASDLQLRQLEAQVKTQDDLSIDACSRWLELAGERASEETSRQKVAFSISDQLLTKVGLKEDLNRNALAKKIISLGLSKDKLWAKHIPDIEVGVMRSNYFDLYLSGGPPVKYTHSWSVGVTLPFNFPFYDNSSYVRESAELSLEKLTSEYERSSAEKTWNQAKRDWKRNTERLQEIQSKDMAMADVLVQGSVAAYRTGKIDFSTLVLARRTKLDLQIEEIQLKAQRLIAKTVCLTECEQ